MEGLLNNNLFSKSSIFGASGGGNIKSIQEGSVIITNRLGTTVTISAINVNTSIVYLQATDNSQNETLGIKGVITNSTTITFTCDTENDTTVVHWVAIEFNNVKSLQVGNFISTVYEANLWANEDITITAVDLNKTMVFCNWEVDAAASSEVWKFLASYSLTTSTNLRFRHNRASYKNVSWQVIEFI